MRQERKLLAYIEIAFADLITERACEKLNHVCLLFLSKPKNLINVDFMQIFQAHKQMMEWANFYNGVSRGLATILNYGDVMDDFGLSNYANRSKDTRRAEQVIANQSQRHILTEEHEHVTYRYYFL
jgi:hypothetical protein